MCLKKRKTVPSHRSWRSIKCFMVTWTLFWCSFSSVYIRWYQTILHVMSTTNFLHLEWPCKLFFSFFYIYIYMKSEWFANRKDSKATVNCRLVICWRNKKYDDFHRQRLPISKEGFKHRHCLHVFVNSVLHCQCFRCMSSCPSSGCVWSDMWLHTTLCLLAICAESLDFDIVKSCMKAAAYAQFFNFLVRLLFKHELYAFPRACKLGEKKKAVWHSYNESASLRML